MRHQRPPPSEDPELERLLDALQAAAGSGDGRELRERVRARLRVWGQTGDAVPDSIYRDLVNAIDFGFCIIEVLFENDVAVDYRFKEVNAAFARHTGLTHATGRRIRELMPDLDAQWFATFGRVALTGDPVRFEEHSRPLGRWYDVFASRCGRTEQHQVAVVFTDITIRKQAEQQLRESEERFRAVADNIPQLAWMTGPRGEILWFNRRWTEYTGLTLEQMQRVGWQAIHHPDHPHSVVERWNRTLETGEQWEDTFQIRRHDGAYRWFLSRAFPIRDAEGRIARWFGTNTDITELRDTEAALMKAHEALKRHAQDLEATVAERTAKLREMVDELEAFSYSVTHDMRAPLRAMQGFAQLLEDEFAPQLGAEGSIYVKRIAAAATRLDQLIRDVLAYSRVVREPVELRPVDPARLIHQLAEENPALQPPHAEIEVRGPLHKVLGHGASLMQVVSNLIYNAVKFVSPGVRPHITIWSEQANGVVKLYVRDNGIGMPAEARDRVFGLFQRFHEDRRYEGTGLGLAIVRKAVERMGGNVSVESEPGQGCTFVVQLRTA